MHSQVPRFASRLGGLARASLPPPYLAPSLHIPVTLSPVQSSSFSSTASVAVNPRRDKSKQRGVSAIHRTGPRHPLTVSKWELPKPVSPEDMIAREQTPNHGLWAFFPPNREALSTPEYDHSFGRSWSIQELRERSWEDLHALWHVCVRERNRIMTSDIERTRLKPGYGEYESGERDAVILSTMKNMKHVLRERWYAYEDAKRLLEKGYVPESLSEKTTPKVKKAKVEHPMSGEQAKA
ncbi:uncharacterized protein N7511_007782 [Penicillium nucicola]|uniref:uncharacterized protein n=1 Tax=Penicillium nucicola TaxID=1850975 RepID=UPI0025454B38|nr:uncharacterized protein N7511_007782 [Penicillium nucicola]KAJ5753629.1 hypothetical protein N7511_007782 [Penicillium nucicola]